MFGGQLSGCNGNYSALTGITRSGVLHYGKESWGMNKEDVCHPTKVSKEMQVNLPPGREGLWPRSMPFAKGKVRLLGKFGISRPVCKS